MVGWGILADDLITIRPLTLEDAPAHLAGEDDEQRKWLAFPRASTMDDAVAYIQRAQTEWQTGTSLRARAVRLASSYVHEVLNLERVVAIIDTENVASRRIAERVGFELEGPAEAWEYGEEPGQMLRYVLRMGP